MVYKAICYKTNGLIFFSDSNCFFLVPMLQRGNAYHMGSHAGAWEPGKEIAAGRVKNRSILLKLKYD